MRDSLPPIISNQRLMMHADYLDVQIKCALKSFDSAQFLAERGANLAKALGAKEDHARFIKLLDLIDNQTD